MASPEARVGLGRCERPIIQLGGKLLESKAKTKRGQRRVFLDHETAELLRSTARPSSDCG
jgi:hypothetical protein